MLADLYKHYFQWYGTHTVDVTPPKQTRNVPIIVGSVAEWLRREVKDQKVPNSIPRKAFDGENC